MKQIDAEVLTAWTGGFLGIALIVLLVILAIYWLLFPIFVMRGMKRLETLLEQSIHLNTEGMKQSKGVIQNASAKQDRTNQLLEWLGTKDGKPEA